jgi:crotonobetainyl-CoA:carnitine CoA-transferase CaiB-like acyl-CoA transferase
VTAKLGVDYETLKAIKPNLIYCSLTGFGQDGPYRDRPGHDINYIGYGGMLGGLGKAPAVPGTTLSDLGAAMFAVIAILAALMQRQKTGTGQYIDVAMLDAVISWAGTEVGWTLAAGSMPAYGIFETKDGYVTLAPIEPKFAANLETVLREAAAPEQKEKVMEPEVMAAILKTKTASDWLTLFDEAEIPCGPVYTPDEAFADPQVRHRGLVVESDSQLGKTRNVLFPVKFSNMNVQQIRRAPAAVGEHTDEVLKALGYSDDDIKALRDEGAI